MANILSMAESLGLPQVFHISYVVEILILWIVIYELLIWVKNTRAWTLLRGIIVVSVFVIAAYLLNLTTITWLIARTGGVLVIVIVIVFQPELRRALEELGRRNIIFSILSTSGTDKEEDIRARDKEKTEIVKGVTEMSKAKTGALIVIENQVVLSEFERTGIPIDAQITSQLLINIFEHNTPLHDGAVFIREGRIVAATCYLPLSDDRELSKELGTRHRAGVGISEVSDSLTIIVSEETGSISLAQEGKLTRGVDVSELRERIDEVIPSKKGSDEAGRERLRGKNKNEKITDK